MDYPSQNDQPIHGSAQPVGDSPGWRLLGELLVDRKLLDPEDLEEALKVQARTGGKLGQILMDLGLVTRSALARALAEQYGVDLTEQTGFGTGLLAVIEQRHADGATGSRIPPKPSEAPESDGDAFGTEAPLESGDDALPADDPPLRGGAGPECTPLQNVDASETVSEGEDVLEARPEWPDEREELLRQRELEVTSLEALIEARLRALTETQEHLDEQLARATRAQRAGEESERHLSQLEAMLERYDSDEPQAQLEDLKTRWDALESRLDEASRSVEAFGGACGGLVERAEAIEAAVDGSERILAKLEAMTDRHDLGELEERLEALAVRRAAVESSLDDVSRRLDVLECGDVHLGVAEPSDNVQGVHQPPTPLTLVECPGAGSAKHVDALQFVDLREFEIDYGVARFFPEWAARRHTALAVALERGVVIIAVADPEAAALDAIRALVDRSARFVVADRSTLLEAISAAYGFSRSASNG